MCSPLKDLFNTRTDNDRKGTVSSDWNRVLLWRDLNRLVAEGLVEPVQPPADIEPDDRARHYFRDLGTGDLYVYVAGWERGWPQFRRVADDYC